MKPWLIRLAVAVMLLSPVCAQAHQLPARQATLNLVGKSAFAVVAVPVSALKGVDDDGDHLLSPQEFGRHFGAIVVQFNQRFTLADQGKEATPTFTWPLTQTGDPQALPSQPAIVVMQRTDFAQVPKHLTLTTDLYGAGPREGQLTVHVTAGPMSQVAIFSPLARTHSLFGGPLQTFRDFVGVGALHILGGPDHLLFLLTVIVAATGWRYWAGVVTSFTLAHSITLTLAALGLVRLSPQIIEPAIALSIVLMALDNLLRPGRSQGRGRLALVFGCGLLHGLGFAGALGDIGLDAVHALASLAGFNLGVELGQVLFLAMVLAVIAAVRRVGCAPVDAWLAPLASGVAAVLGVAMLVGRIFAAFAVAN